jgi:pimeloyl-ACP methyl ester carboxylesterase
LLEAVALAGFLTAAGGYADLEGVRLFYIDSGGEGAPVVFLHSATGSARVWEHQIPAFTRAGYRVIAYDRRGYGRTLDARANPPPAADDLEALVKHLGIERFHLVGTAAGGMVATDYAHSFPHRLRSLVVANSIVGIQDEEYLAMSQRLRPPEFSKLPPDFRELGPSYRAANPEGVRRWLELERSSRAPGGAELPPQPWKNRVTYRSLSAIPVAALLLTGDADLYTPPSVLRLIAEKMPGAQLRIVPETGHCAYWEKPELFNAAVLEFIGKH